MVSLSDPRQVGAARSSRSATSSCWSAGRWSRWSRTPSPTGWPASRRPSPTPTSSTPSSSPSRSRCGRSRSTPSSASAMSLLLVRYEFPGKRALSALIDLPMAVSPVVIGLALLLVYNGRDGWFGPTLEAHGIQVIFDSPGMIMATCFVSLPLVIREVVPVLDRDRRRPGAGRHEPRRERVADAAADHPARHQVGGRLRRRADAGPLARRVRRPQDRLGKPHRPDPDRAPGRRAEVPQLRPGRGVRRLVHAGADQRALHRRRLPAAPQGESTS